MTLPTHKRNEILVKMFFQKIRSSTKWKCICNTVREKGQGWSNLLSHIHSQHANFMTQSSLEKALKTPRAHQELTTKTIWLNTWMELVCIRLQPFSFVEDELIRRTVSVDPISRNSLTKYMSLLTHRVERHISACLPDKFAIVIDGWTNCETHYLAVFGTYPCHEHEENNGKNYSSVLLAVSPLLDETTLTASAHEETISYILSVYDKSWENVVAIIGDNVSTNKALASLVGRFLIGCASHRFNLAVCDIIESNSDTVQAIRSIMVKLRTLKYAAHLRNHIDLKPILSNTTRWSSTFQMLKRYIELIPAIREMDIAEINDLLPSNAKHSSITQLLETLSVMDSVCKQLQSESTTIADVRALFDAIITKFPETEERLSCNANIIYNSEFENALVKLQEHRTYDLTNAERSAVHELLNTHSTANHESENISFAERAVKRRRQETTGQGIGYMNTCFITPTSNMVERLFSKAGWTLSDRRTRLTPEHFEQQLFLFSNAHLWGLSDINFILSN